MSQILPYETRSTVPFVLMTDRPELLARRGTAGLFALGRIRPGRPGERRARVRLRVPSLGESLPAVRVQEDRGRRDRRIRAVARHREPARGPDHRVLGPGPRRRRGPRRPGPSRRLWERHGRQAPAGALDPLGRRRRALRPAQEDDSADPRSRPRARRCARLRPLPGGLAAPRLSGQSPRAVPAER